MSTLVKILLTALIIWVVVSVILAAIHALAGILGFLLLIGALIFVATAVSHFLHRAGSTE